MKRLLLAVVVWLLCASNVFAAIARDTLAGNTSLGLDNPTSGNAYTRAFNCGSGSLRRLYFAYFGTVAAGDAVTGVTYAGTTMRLVAHLQEVSGRWAGLYALDAPATGSNNIIAAVSPNDTIEGWAACYTGVKQTNADAGSGTNASTSTTSLAVSFSVAPSNSWGIAFSREESGVGVTWTGAVSNNLSDAGGGHFADSNATIGTGTQTATETFSGNQNTVMIFAAFEPDTGGGATSHPCGSLRLLGVGCEDEGSR